VFVLRLYQQYSSELWYFGIWHLVCRRMTGSGGNVNTYGQCNWWRGCPERGRGVTSPAATLSYRTSVKIFSITCYLNHVTWLKRRTLCPLLRHSPLTSFRLTQLCPWATTLWRFEALRKLIVVILTSCGQQSCETGQRRRNYSHYCLLPCLVVQRFLSLR